MDDATRAELSALRRRAFGPAADIAGDSAALDRLAALEAVAHAEHDAEHREAEGRPVSGWDAATVASLDDEAPLEGRRDPRLADGGMPQPGAVPAPGPPAPGPPGPAAPEIATRRPPRRDGAALAIAAALVAVAVVASSAQSPRAPETTEAAAAAPSAYAAALHDGAQQVFEIPVGGWYGIQMATPSPDETPPFPASGPVLWATALGEYYGWELWIAGAAGSRQLEHCLLLVQGGVTRGRCVPASTRSEGGLHVSLTYRLIQPDERPEGFAPGQSLGFWWARDDVVSILHATSAL